MRNQQVIKLFLILIVSTIFIFSLSHFGASAFDSATTKADQFGEGTMIGSFSIAGKTRNEALQVTDEQLTKWLNETEITFKYREKSEILDLSYFVFDLEKSVSLAQHGQANSVLVELEPIEDFLTALSPSLPVSELKMEELRSEILSHAKHLTPGKYEIRIDFFLADDSNGSLTTIAEHQIPTDRQLELFIGESIEIGPTTQFSLLHYVEEIGSLSSSNLSKIATGIYNVILPTNFSIIERHISSEIPAYAELGFEAKVDKDLNQDLVFSNPNEFSYFIEFKRKDGNLLISLKGPKFLSQFIISTEDMESFEPKTIRQFNPQLGPTEIRVKTEGKPGHIIKVYREYRDEKGAVLQKELISEDFYPPIHQVEVQGLIVNEETPPLEDIEEIVEGDLSELEELSELPDIPEEYLNELENGLWGKENEIPK